MGFGDEMRKCDNCGKTKAPDTGHKLCKDCRGCYCEKCDVFHDIDIECPLESKLHGRNINIFEDQHLWLKANPDVNLSGAVRKLVEGMMKAEGVK